MTTIKELDLRAISVGDLLPALEVPLTRTLIMAGALATRDFEDVHHDPQRAVDRGTPDTFMSINNTNGLVTRYVTDWTGPAVFVAHLSTRLGVPNFPGDTMILTGEVKAKEGKSVTIAVRGNNSRGSHVVSTVIVKFQASALGKDVSS